MGAAVQRKTYRIVITADPNGGFVGRCGELHANSQGETYGEVVENMRVAVGLAAEVMDNVADFGLLISQR